MRDNILCAIRCAASLFAFGLAAGAAITVTGAGSTFIYPVLGKWAAEYRKLNPGVQIAYDPVGSGRGISRTLAGTVDFGASDGPMSDAQLKLTGRKILHIPVALGAVVPAYNLPGITQQIRFTAGALAGVFLGNIKRWNDAELTKANPDIHLPANEIAVVFRSDGSGTTYVWTDYLSKASEAWTKRVGRGTSVGFPAGMGAQFNEGVRDALRRRPYSIGYLEVTYALQGNIQYGLVQNPAGTFVKATGSTITAAAAGAEKNMPDDFRISITNAPGLDSYPVASFTWLLIPTRTEDHAKAQAILGFVRWVLGDGQKLAGPLNYAPLPAGVAGRALKTLDRIE